MFQPRRIQIFRRQRGELFYVLMSLIYIGNERNARASVGVHRAVVIGYRRGNEEVGRVLRHDYVSSDEIRRYISRGARGPVRSAEQRSRPRIGSEPTQFVFRIRHRDYHTGDSGVVGACQSARSRSARKHTYVSTRTCRHRLLTGKEPVSERRIRRSPGDRKSSYRTSAARSVGAETEDTSEISLSSYGGHRSGCHAVDLCVFERARADVQTDNAAHERTAARARRAEILPDYRRYPVHRTEVDACHRSQSDVTDALRVERESGIRAARAVIGDVGELAVVNTDYASVCDCRGTRLQIDLPCRRRIEIDRNVFDGAVVDGDEIAYRIERHPAYRLRRGVRIHSRVHADRERIASSVESLPVRKDSFARSDKSRHRIRARHYHGIGESVTETVRRFSGQERLNGSAVAEVVCGDGIAVFHRYAARGRILRDLREVRYPYIGSVVIVAALAVYESAAHVSFEFEYFMRPSRKVGQPSEIYVLQQSRMRLARIVHITRPYVRSRRADGSKIRSVAVSRLSVHASDGIVHRSRIVCRAVAVSEYRHLRRIERIRTVDLYGRPGMIIPPTRAEIGIVNVDIIRKRSIRRARAESSADYTDIISYARICLVVYRPSVIAYVSQCCVCRVSLGFNAEIGMPVYRQIVDRPRTYEPVRPLTVEVVRRPRRGEIRQSDDKPRVTRLVVPYIVVHPAFAAVDVQSDKRASVVDTRDSADGTAVDGQIIDRSVPGQTARPKLQCRSENADIGIERNFRAQDISGIVTGNASDRRHVLIRNFLDIGLPHDRERTGKKPVFIVDRNGTVAYRSRIIAGDHAHGHVAVELRSHYMIAALFGIAVHHDFHVLDRSVVRGNDIAQRIYRLAVVQSIRPVGSVVAPPLKILRRPRHYMRSRPLRLIYRIERRPVVDDGNGMSVSVERPRLAEHKIGIQPRRKRYVGGQIAVACSAVDKGVKRRLISDRDRARRYAARCVAVVQRLRRRDFALLGFARRRFKTRARIKNSRENADKRHGYCRDRRDKSRFCGQFSHFPSFSPLPYIAQLILSFTETLKPPPRSSPHRS